MNDVILTEGTEDSALSRMRLRCLEMHINGSGTNTKNQFRRALQLYRGKSRKILKTKLQRKIGRKWHQQAGADHDEEQLDEEEFASQYKQLSSSTIKSLRETLDYSDGLLSVYCLQHSILTCTSFCTLI